MNDYDFYLRHASVHDGDWVGFALAWKGPVDLAGLSAQPYLQERPWVLDPAYPDDPTHGSWGVRQWRLDVALLDRIVGLLGTPPSDGRTAADMRADLLAYQNLPVLALQDADGTEYSVVMAGYSERLVQPFDYASQKGGWVARVVFAEVTA